MESTLAYDFALLLLRVGVGLTLAAHGWNKFFGGGRISGTGRWLNSIGIKPGRFNALLAAISELGSGFLMALGLLTPFAAAGVIGVMVVAGWTVHRSNGFFIIKEGWEYIYVLALVALVSAILGPGSWSLDAQLGIAKRLDGFLGFWIALGFGLGGGLLQMILFFRPSTVKSED